MLDILDEIYKVKKKKEGKNEEAALVRVRTDIGSNEMEKAQSDLKKTIFKLKRERLKLCELMNFKLSKPKAKNRKKVCNSCQKYIDWDALICPSCGEDVFDEYSEKITEIYADKIGIIQLNVTSKTKSFSIFTKGINKISISDSDFKNSKLYAILQMFNADHYYIFTSEGPCFLELENEEIKIEGIDGEKLVIKKENHDKLLIMRRKCSPKLAEELLHLIM